MKRNAILSEMKSLDDLFKSSQERMATLKSEFEELVPETLFDKPITRTLEDVEHMGDIVIVGTTPKEQLDYLEEVTDEIKRLAIRCNTYASFLWFKTSNVEVREKASAVSSSMKDVITAMIALSS